jgi:hypothetical protein
MHRLSIISLLTALMAVTSSAQLSPGPLSRPHADLEGLENCSKCHGFDQKLAPDKCLSCHIALADRIKAGLGYHANAEHKDCGVCHVEHQGKEFDLVYWKNGESKFDHGQTGYMLEGKHAALKCRKCHFEKNIVAKDKLPKVDIARTYLGLGRECLTCHPDEHRGQLATNCLTCHQINGWKPAAVFDHAKAKYILTGKHSTVDCNKCHLTIPDDQTPDTKGYVKFTGLQFEKCLDCHKDAHANKFGQDCESCHNTTGWINVNQAKFDHSKTRYPLEGKHVIVACEKCHVAGKFKGLQFTACSDCHSDYHQGQLVSRPNKGACEECHAVAGFEIAKFTLGDHQKITYALAGSHLAVPCDGCHKKEVLAGKAETIRLKFENTRCQICHEDPHKGAIDIYMPKGGCEFCHLVESWRASTYDHSQAKFALEGRHKNVDCRSCHAKSKQDSAQLEFSGLTQKCADCHEDIHRGQFAKIISIKSDASNQTDCDRCHSPVSWKPEKFDHNRDTAFKLDGAHINVSCSDCHKPTVIEGKSIIRYKPLGSSCSDCHGGKMLPGEGGKS